MRPKGYVNFLKEVLILGLILCLISITGCATQEEGSSLPWSQPEPWETQVLPNMEE